MYWRAYAQFCAKLAPNFQFCKYLFNFFNPLFTARAYE